MTQPTGADAGHDAPMVAGTIVARNYLPQARVLAESYQAHHPGHRFVTLLVDGDERDAHGAHAVQGAGDIITLADLAVPPLQLHRMAGMYTVLELSTALKPAFLQALLRDAPAALYLDPDMQVFGALHDAFDGALSHGISLTPHVVDPMPRDGLEPGEDRIRHSGIFNLGFIAVAAQARPFLQWWHERLETDAVVDLPNALFTDQRWIDWVPALYGAKVLRDTGLNVAYWNLHERPLSVRNGIVHAGDRPLRLLHLSGYEPSQPWQLSKHASRAPRVRLTHSAVLAELCDLYAAALERHGWNDRARDYGWATTAGGVALDPLVRWAVRRSMLKAATGADSLPPDPFAQSDETGDAFTEWLDSPAPGPWGVPVGRWALSFWEADPGVQAHFPRLDLDDAANYQDWLTRFEPAVRRRADAGLPPSPPPTLPLPSTQRETGGWNLVGYATSAHGVGEAARRVRMGLERAGLAHHAVALPLADDPLQHQRPRTPNDRLRFRDSIYCVNADMLPHSLARLEHHHRVRDDARRVGLWFWELATMPTHFADALRTLEQVWVASEFTAEAVQSLQPDIPVRVITLPLPLRGQPTPYTRASLGLPEEFLFVVNCDFNSVPDRKNPLGAVTAFRRAFPAPGTAHLVVKTLNAERSPAHHDRLRRAAEGRCDITLIDEVWPAPEVAALHELADCYVSLHRSEGFGLNIADAMEAATPVIATGYSGNMRFCDSSSTYLVPYTLVPVGPGQEPYDADAEWAEPNLDVAADMMRHVATHPAEAAAMGARARQHVRAVLSVEAACDDMKAVLHGRLAPDRAVTWW